MSDPREKINLVFGQKVPRLIVSPLITRSYFWYQMWDVIIKPKKSGLELAILDYTVEAISATLLPVTAWK